MNLFKYIFYFKYIKTIKNEAKKGLFIARDPRGCNVACKADNMHL